MFHFFHKKRLTVNSGTEPRKDKRYLIALFLLAAFVGFSLVTGISSGTLQKMIRGFRFHFFDGAAIIVLTVFYLIFRIKGGRNHDQ